MNDRVRRPLNFEILLQDLGGPSENSKKPFRSLKSALIFSAALAVHKNLKPVPFDKSGEKILFAYFNGEYERSFISSLALSISDDLSIIHPSRTSDQISIFEEMANAGLIWINDNISAFPSYDLFFLQIISESKNSDSPLDEFFG